MAKVDLNWLRQSVVGNAAWALLAAIGAAAMGMLKANQYALVDPILFGLATFFFFLGSIAMIRLLASLAQTTITPENVKGYIRDWIDQYGLGVKSLADEALLFSFVITTNGRKIGVSQRRDFSRKIHFRASVTLDDTDRAALDAAPGGADGAIRNLRIHLIGFQIGYSGVGKPLTEITLTKVIPLTAEFNEHDFIGALDKVEGGIALVNEVLNGPIMSTTRPQIT